LVVFVLVAGFYLAGGLEFLEYKLIDFRFLVAPRQATEQVIVVDIDTTSLRELGVWPWPRAYHAKVLDTLLAAGARRIAFDIDFSSRSTAKDDRAFAEALKRGAGRVVLPIFKQFDPAAADKQATTLTFPLAAFAKHADLGFVNVRPEIDGLVRRMALDDEWKGTTLPTMVAALAPVEFQGTGMFYIDFGILPETIPRISYARVLNGAVDPDLFAGKDIIVGTTAIELGDQLAVPLYRAASGSIVQASAYESLVQGRDLRRVAVIPILVFALLLALIVGPELAALSWRQGLGVLAVVSGGGVGTALALELFLPVLLDVTPWLLVPVGSYLLGLVATIDRQTLRLALASLTATHRRAVIMDLVGNSFDGVIIVGAGGVIDMFNPAAERLFERPASEVIGAKIGILFPPSPDGRDDEGARIAGVIESGDSNTLPIGMREIGGRRKDGTAFEMELTVSEYRLKTENRSAAKRRSRHHEAFVFTVRDITERKRAEENKRCHQAELAHVQRLSTIGEMAAEMAHEINQPFGAIAAYAEGCMHRSRNQKLKQDELYLAVESISEQAQRAGNIINQIRGYVRKAEALKPGVDVNNAVEDAAGFFGGGIRVDETIMWLDLAESLPTVQANPLQIQQVILNLAWNGIEAMNGNGPQPRQLSIRTSRPNGKFIEIAVQDTGPGIPTDVQDHVFDPFFTTKSDGLGMGLSISRSIVNDHGGQLWCAPSNERGTIFRFTLPVEAQVAN
jgi:PAS domain S-box-containing protein